MIWNTILEMVLVFVALVLYVFLSGKNIGEAIRYFKRKEYDKFGISVVTTIMFLSFMLKMIIVL